jgi:hypothetical protein
MLTTMRLLIPLAVSLLFLSSCAKQTRPATGPHATVTLRDGSTASGNVLSTSATEIQLAGDDKITRTIPMTQVRSIDYGAAANAAPAPASSSEPAASAPPVAASAPPPSARPAANPEPVAPPDSDHAEHYHPTEAAITTKTHRLPAGTEISVRTEETIDSGKAAEGQSFPAEVTRDVRDADGNTVIPRGANAQLIIRSASRGGHFRGASDLVLDLRSVAVGGREYALTTSDVSAKGREGVGANKRTGEFVGGGAAIGAIIGAIAGHGKGAAIGAGAGAGGGALTQILTRGQVRVPVESVLTFRLEAPLRVVAE